MFVTLFGPLVNPLFEGIIIPRVVVGKIHAGETGVTRADIQDFASGFVAPLDVALDSKGNLYIADYGGNQVYKVAWTGHPK